METELLPLIGCALRVKGTGEWSLFRRAKALETSSAQVTLDDSNIVSYTPIQYDYPATRNQIEIKWNYSNYRKELTRT